MKLIMQNYGRALLAPHAIRTIASGCHNNGFILIVNYIPNFLQNKLKFRFVFEKQTGH